MLPQAVGDLSREAWSLPRTESVIKASIPVLYFGNVEAYLNSERRIVTVGKNPSFREFPVEDPFYRFPKARKLKTLGQRTDVDAYLRSLNEYFDLHPLDWFTSYNEVLGGLGASYFTGASNAAIHTDLLSPWATMPAWRGVADNERRRLQSVGIDIWRKLIEFLNPHLILFSMRRQYLADVPLAATSALHEMYSLSRAGRKPYIVLRRTYEPEPGSSTTLVFGPAAQIPFGVLSHRAPKPNQKRQLGEEIGRQLFPKVRRETPTHGTLNQQLSDLFHNFASLMELKGESVFKVIAFQKVGRILKEMSIDLRKCIEEGKLCEIEGIGKSSQAIIEEYVETGKSSAFEDLKSTVPVGLVPLLQIEGMGPKTIHVFWKQLNITSLEELSAAIESGKLEGLKGMGEKKIASIQKGIETYKSRVTGVGGAPQRTGIADAEEQAEPLVAQVRKIPGVVRAEIAGSLRRRRETIGDVDLIAGVQDASDGARVIGEFVKLPGVIQTIGAGESKASVKVANGMQVDLRVVPNENFGAALLYFTGSKEHNVKIRGLAQKQKMTLNEWGLYKLDQYEKAKKETAKAPQLKPVASESEESIYIALGLAFIDPEMREDFGEVELAKENKLPRLITAKDIRGDLHTHTTASDGRNSIEEMAAAARAAGYEFLGVTDHSKALAMARGLTVDRLIKHIEEIHRISDKLKGITLLAGAEVDILVDGRLDYEDDVLKLLDIVVASPHVSLKQDSKKATDRLLRAIDNKYVNIIGHPTGRLINGREGLPLEMDKLFDRAAKNGTALEINAGYPRLDLNDVNARAAIQAGCKLAIDTDTHTDSFVELKWGIGVARRAWATPTDVINCMKLVDLKKFISVKRDR